MPTPVIRAASSLLFHTPGLVRYGSKPAREAPGDDSLAELTHALRPYDQVVAYGPNQVFIGNLSPWDLHKHQRPWYGSPLEDAKPEGRSGVIVGEEEFYTWLLLADEFNLISARPGPLEELRGIAAASPLLDTRQRERLGRSLGREASGSRGDLLLLFADGREFGSIRSDHQEDASLSADVLLENLAAKASGAFALRWMLARAGIFPGEVDYVIGCSEEAIGDRYQRGGGNLGKAIAELAECRAASGADVKDFCAGPLTAMVMGASLVHAGVFQTVAVVGGGSLPKLGMKYRHHLAKGLPVLEDVLGATAVLIGVDDGQSPRLRLDSVGTHRVGDDPSIVGVAKALTDRPLKRLGLRFLDVDRYVGELHNPEITVPAGGGDVPEKNCRTIAMCAVNAGEVAREELGTFVATRGVPGFAPTQGHVASGVCFTPHVLEMMRSGALRRVMFLGKASCFLGRMTQLPDALSFLVEFGSH
jgi:betaine reductase